MRHQKMNHYSHSFQKMNMASVVKKRCVQGIVMAMSKKKLTFVRRPRKSFLKDAA